MLRDAADFETSQPIRLGYINHNYYISIKENPMTYSFTATLGNQCTEEKACEFQTDVDQSLTPQQNPEGPESKTQPAQQLVTESIQLSPATDSPAPVRLISQQFSDSEYNL